MSWPLAASSAQTFAWNPRDLFCDLDRSHPGRNVLDERSASRVLRARRTVHAVQQFADRDDADRAVLVSDCVLDLRIGDTAFEICQHVGVDQDRHASSGGPTDSRAARMSRANSASTAGAVAISSRKRSAAISRDFGGRSPRRLLRFG